MPADFPPIDGEELAVKVLAARASRLRRAILFPGIVAGLVGAVVGYWLVREAQFALFNVQVPWISGVVGSLPPFAASLRITQKLGDAAVRKRAPQWVEEQIRRHRLQPGVLDEYTTVL